ncbi:MAG: hypothetical protein EBU03_05430, partial [Methylophilaceae bacterium]|nr:hypothetical protein [Methylophilaceae bacterium]
MTSSNTSHHFDTATETLLKPSNLDVPALQSVLGNIMTHEVDYADLYFCLLYTSDAACLLYTSDAA